jgi:hypothetical protein
MKNDSLLLQRNIKFIDVIAEFFARLQFCFDEQSLQQTRKFQLLLVACAAELGR